MNQGLAIKVASTWTALVYIICYVGIALFPGLRTLFFEYALHARVDLGQSVMNLGTFVWGLVFWVVLAIIGAWLLATLVNQFKK